MSCLVHFPAAAATRRRATNATVAAAYRIDPSRERRSAVRLCSRLHVQETKAYYKTLYSHLLIKKTKIVFIYFFLKAKSIEYGDLYIYYPRRIQTGKTKIDSLNSYKRHEYRRPYREIILNEFFLFVFNTKKVHVAICGGTSPYIHI